MCEASVYDYFENPCQFVLMSVKSCIDKSYVGENWFVDCESGIGVIRDSVSDVNEVADEISSLEGVISVNVHNSLERTNFVGWLAGLDSLGGVKISGEDGVQWLDSFNNIDVYRIDWYRTIPREAYFKVDGVQIGYKHGRIVVDESDVDDLYSNVGIFEDLLQGEDWE